LSNISRIAGTGGGRKSVSDSLLALVVILATLAALVAAGSYL
jgi:hypothetical protein